MKILVLGGTSFVGRYLVEAAEKNGHEVVLFNRGKTNSEVFKHLRHIQGDRRQDAHLVGEEEWDAVFDTCAYSPQDLQPMLDVLKNKKKPEIDNIVKDIISAFKDSSYLIQESEYVKQKIGENSLL